MSSNKLMYKNIKSSLLYFLQKTRKGTITVFSILATLFIAQNGNAQDFNIILGRPTNSAITISILFKQSTEFYIQYGTNASALNQNTDTFSTTSVFPSEIELINLLTNQLYFYKVYYKTLSASNFLVSSTFHFRTQRTSGETFRFTVEADEHLYDKKGVRSLYDICLKNQAAANPDFMLTLGDIFGDDHYPYSITEQEIDNLHEQYRPILGNITHSIPFYVCLGNHEGEMDYYLNQNPGNNMAYYATKYRQLYYPNPSPNSFYSGNTQQESWGIGYPENYYAWKWGDALFVVLDVYRDQCDTSAKPGGWSWTLGEPQYQWLKSTLENNTSKFKFVFAHHISGQGRGGINQAKLFEWGGNDSKGQNNFNNKRPGWGKPIHQLFVDNGVNIFFQGHDHVFAHETLDGVIYQALPMPCDSTYMIGKLANADAYTQDTLAGSGHLTVTVSATCVKVAYMSAFLPKDTNILNQKNNQVVFEYAIGDCSTLGEQNPQIKPTLRIYPNPAANLINFELQNVLSTNSIQTASNSKNPIFEIYDLTGKRIATTSETAFDSQFLPAGIYVVKAHINQQTLQSKFIKTPN